MCIELECNRASVLQLFYKPALYVTGVAGEVIALFSCNTIYR